jgi:hypothetical protein
MLFNSFLFLLFNAIHARVVVQAPNKSMERILSELNKKRKKRRFVGWATCARPSSLEKKVKKKTALHTSSCLHHSFDANVHYGRRKE